MFQIDSENKLSTDEEGLDGSWMRLETRRKGALTSVMPSHRESSARSHLLVSARLVVRVDSAKIYYELLLVHGWYRDDSGLGKDLPVDGC